MLVELDKRDLSLLVMGTKPYYSLFEHPQVKGRGKYYDQTANWDWNTTKLQELSEQELYDLFILCRDSWK
jgi:hypothetical protein